ncbi:hypothetical protein [Gaiella occulta]|uniref:hypothetical protein n=1 Tax=Gaiella occulta TaxID=1002870 RepID=UPI000E0B6438|nr:hypothetical protein [Gaiella occulta]
MTRILAYIDPTRLPAEVTEILEQIGPYLAAGLSSREIGQRFGRSDDWASTRIAKVRRALLDEAVRSGREMEAGLLERIEELRGEIARGAAGATTRKRQTAPPDGTTPTDAPAAEGS